MAEYITFKRWRLRREQQEADLLRLVREEIEPLYRELAGCRGLGLLRMRGTRAYLALQRWESHAAWAAATSAPEYGAWMQRYRPILTRWDEMMALEDEWEADDLLSSFSAP